MGVDAENIASMYDISRQEKDELGVLSHNRARAAMHEGLFAQEITPVVIKSRRGDGCVQNRPNIIFQCKLNQYITSKDHELPIIYSIFHLHSIGMHINVILVHHRSIAFPFL